MWFISETATTVGFGDITPLTKLGRLSTMISCFIGVFILSLLTVTTKAKLELHADEVDAMIYLKSIRVKSKFRL